MRTITLAVFACILLVGCNSPTTATRLGAKYAALGGLEQTDASVSDAETVKMIAINVKDVVGEGWDPDSLRFLINEAINAHFEGSQRLIYLSIVDDIMTIIEDEIAAADPPLDLGEAGIYIEAAALGVEQGATIYIFAQD
jgi:hypothetical protein